MTVIDEVPRAARAVASEWRSLHGTHGTGDVFDSAAITHLPTAAQRWLTAAIAEGTPLARTARLTMRGSILLRSWRTFTATQIITPGRGFIWAATSRVAGLPVSGFDLFVDGTGEMRWRLAGAIPVMTIRGADVTRSAAGRLAGESILVPTTFDQVTWKQSAPDTVTMTWALQDCESETVAITVAHTGAPTQLTMYRWGNPFELGYRRYRFVVDFAEQHTFDGIAIPTRLNARWEDDETGNILEFFRARIVAAAYQ